MFRKSFDQMHLQIWKELDGLTKGKNDEVKIYILLDMYPKNQFDSHKF